MGFKKPTILLIWGYHRKGWVEPFVRLEADFNFQLLYYLKQPEEEENFTNFPTHYWLDFSSAKAIIEEVKPDKVVFMSAEGIPSTALNAACKRKGIPTIVLQHGLFHPYETYLIDAKLQSERALELGKSNHNKSNSKNVNRLLLLFYLRSFTLFTIFGALNYLVRLRWMRRKNYEIEALRLVQSKLRITDFYLVITKYTSSYFSVRDGVQDHQMIEIGFPEFDEYTPEKVASEPYYLYIHSPLAHIPEYDSEGYMSQQEENKCIEKLNEFALTNGCKLYVKLHPYSYTISDLVDDPNIIYIRDGDNASLILRSMGVMGYNSTLVLPAAYYKNVCLFTLSDFSHLQEDLEAIGAVKLLPFHTFSPSDLTDAMDSSRKTDTSILLRNYLFKLDGKALERLKHFLLSEN